MQHTLLSAFLLLGMSCHSAGARLGRASRELMGIATVPKTVAAPIPAPGSQAVYGPVPEAFSVPAREAVPAPLRKTTPAPVPTPMFAALPGRASVPVPAPTIAALPGRATAPVPSDHMGHVSLVPGRAPAQVPSDHMGPVSLVPGRAPAPVPSGDLTGPVSLVPGGIGGTVPLPSPTSQLPGSAPSPGRAQQASALQWPGLSDPGSAGRLEYHGGPLLTGTITVYVIYYGNWPENAGQFVLEGFVNSLSSTEADDQVRPQCGAKRKPTLGFLLPPFLHAAVSSCIAFTAHLQCMTFFPHCIPRTCEWLVASTWIRFTACPHHACLFCLQGPSVRRWWEIATKYTDSSGTPVASQVVYGGAVTIGGAPGSYSTQLGDGFDSTTNDDIKPCKRLFQNRRDRSAF